jgi:RHS repeat-associated protein
LGSIRNIVDSSGEMRLHRQFDAFGNIVAEIRYNETGTPLAPGSFEHETLEIAFSGRPYDSATGLQNNLNRWYDPRLGRWMSEDPIGYAGGDANLYRYVGNRPTDWRDPLGLVVNGPAWDQKGGMPADGGGGCGGGTLSNGSGGDRGGGAAGSGPAPPGMAGGGKGDSGPGRIPPSQDGGTGGIGGDGGSRPPISVPPPPLFGDGSHPPTSGPDNSPEATGPVPGISPPPNSGGGGDGPDRGVSPLPHGNSYDSPRPAHLYGLHGPNGFMKWGITQNPKRRYTKEYMKDKVMDIIDIGSRINMACKERELVETRPGPENHEPWAGRQVPGLP